LDLGAVRNQLHLLLVSQQAGMVHLRRQTARLEQLLLDQGSRELVGQHLVGRQLEVGHLQVRRLLHRGYEGGDRRGLLERELVVRSERGLLRSGLLLLVLLLLLDLLPEG